MELSDYRNQIDHIDKELIRLFAERMDVAAEIAAYKKEHGLAVLDPARERAKLLDVAEQTPEALQEYAVSLYSLLFELSRSYQSKRNGECSPLYRNITQAIEHGYAYMSEKMGGSRQHEVTVTSIVLTNVLVPMRDTVEYQMLVPAWVVFYEEDLGLGEPLRDFIAVNAVDGSLVDLQVTPEMM